jgi:UDP-4-amino-4,6-dideoxy-N-acetyl-beta-L-altrosamine transaminase
MDQYKFREYRQNIMIPYGRQDIDSSDIDAVLSVLKSDFLTQGPIVPKFEKSVSSHVKVKHSIAVNSATSALHIACLALELKSNEWLWTSPITFVASANCGLYCGANIDFVDIDEKTYNICPDALEEKLIKAKLQNKIPKVVVVVHLCGQPSNMSRIRSLSIEYGFYIIEDASHAIGGKYKDEFIGCCKYSDITVFSFHPVKIITTAEGGMALTNDSELARKLDLYRSHGITRNEQEMTHISDGPWYYQQVALGYNYRMTEIQAALGLSQIKRLDQYVSARHKLAERYNLFLDSFPVIKPWQAPDSYSGFHLYVIRLELNKLTKSHKRIFQDLRKLEIGVNVHYIPVHLQPFYQKMGFKKGDFPEAEKYYSDAISLPLFQTLTFSEQDRVITSLKEVLI